MLFWLNGEVNYDVGSCHDSRMVKIDNYFSAPNIKSAITKAKEMVQKYHQDYKHRTDYALEAKLFIGNPKTKTFTVWETRWQKAKAYVPPQPAIPARKAGFRSKRFK